MSRAQTASTAVIPAFGARGSSICVHGMMLIATFLVATSFPVVAAVTGGLDSGVLTFLRFALASLLFAPLVAWRYGLTVPSGRDLVRYGVLGLLLVTFFWCMFASLRLTTPLNTAAIFALMPIMTAGLAAVVLREKLGVPSRIALPVGATGAVWVVFRGDLSALMSLQIGAGDATFLAGTLALAVYSTLVKVLHRGEPMARMTFWTLTAGAGWLFVLSLPSLVTIQWAEVPARVFAGVAYLSVFTTIVTFFVFQWSTNRIGPTRVVSYTFLNPAIVLVLGLAFGGEVPPLTIWPGVGLAVAATAILQSNSAGRDLPARSVSGPAPQN
ncbi:MAG: DMT family transporter [Pseudomonadota bacterium]